MTRTASRRRRARVAAVTVLLGLLVTGGAPSAGKEPSAEQIVEEMIDKDPLGYGGAEARVLMVLVNNRDQERKRKVVMMSRKDGDTRRMYLRFLSPTDVAGTAFLGIDDGGDRTQHLYMPALSKTRRISSSQRNASFVGTDYSYADMDFRDVDDSKKKRLADDEVAGQPAYVIEVQPSDSESAYGRIRLWISKSTMLPLRIRFFDDGGHETKRLSVAEVKNVDGRWIISESKMVDLKREHTTVLKVIEIQLRDDIPLERFSVRALERG